MTLRLLAHGTANGAMPHGIGLHGGKPAGIDTDTSR